MDRLEAMSMLIAAVETGSLSAAGRKLSVPLPTISRKISELETHLATRLLVRSTRKLMLTDAGAAYVTSCRRILEQVSDAERAASGEYNAPRGDLIIAAPIVFGRLHVLPVVTQFLAMYPEIDVQLALSDRYVDLIGDQIDLAVRIGTLSDSSLIASRVGLVRRVICGSPAYFARYGIPKTPSELSALKAVTFEALGPSTSWNFRMLGLKSAQTVAIRSRLSVNTAEAAIDAAVAGIGVTRVLSYQAAPAVEEGKLQIVLADFETDPLPVSIVHGGQALLPRKVRAFLDFAAPYIQRRLTGATPAGKRARRMR